MEKMCTVGGNVKCTNAVENSMEMSQKINDFYSLKFVNSQK